MASELEKAGFNIPLLIGGATTFQAAHGPEDRSCLQFAGVVYLKDASQNAGVASKLLNPELKDSFAGRD